MIIFLEKEHTYVHLESGNKLTGWTSLIKKFTKPFDSENQLICSAYKLVLGKNNYNSTVKKEFGRLFDLDIAEVAQFLKSNVNLDIDHIISEIRYEWEYSAINGSKFHKMFEDRAYSEGFAVSPFTEKKYATQVFEKQYDNQSLFENLFDLPDGFYPELLVWDYTMSQKKTVVTQIDRCFIETINGERFVEVDDIKSNKERPIEYKKEFMMAPLDSLYDNIVEKYKLQVNFGLHLLSTFGFKPRYSAFTHYLNYEENNSKIYPAKYDKQLMDKFQEAWKNVI